jgi:hypothetical protein
VKHLRYLRYLWRHKWYVFLACRRRGLWFAGLTHDLSKFTPAEWGPYADRFFGSPRERDASRARFDVAKALHKRRNPHHWEFWVSTNGQPGPRPMPDRYRREMLADWEGAQRSIGGEDSLRAWYSKERDAMQLHPDTRAWVDEQVGWLPIDRPAQ